MPEKTQTCGVILPRRIAEIVRIRAAMQGQSRSAWMAEAVLQRLDRDDVPYHPEDNPDARP